MAKKKRKRLLTNREWTSKGSYEAIEMDDEGRFFWVAVDTCLDMEACFPVDEEFVRSEFKAAGREYVSSRISPGFIIT